MLQPIVDSPEVGPTRIDMADLRPTMTIASRAYLITRGQRRSEAKTSKRQKHDPTAEPSLAEHPSSAAAATAETHALANQHRCRGPLQRLVRRRHTPCAALAKPALAVLDSR